jgi:hypothetical protein
MRFTGQNKKNLNVRYFLNEAVSADQQSYANAAQEILDNQSLSEQEKKSILSIILYLRDSDLVSKNRITTVVPDLANAIKGTKNFTSPQAENAIRAVLTRSEVDPTKFDMIQAIDNRIKSLDELSGLLLGSQISATTPQRATSVAATSKSALKDVPKAPGEFQGIPNIATQAKKSFAVRCPNIAKKIQDQAVALIQPTSLPNKEIIIQRMSGRNSEFVGVTALSVLNASLKMLGQTELPSSMEGFKTACKGGDNINKAIENIKNIKPAIIAAIIDRGQGQQVASVEDIAGGTLAESKQRDLSYNRIKEQKNKKLFEALIKG